VEAVLSPCVEQMMGVLLGQAGEHAAEGRDAALRSEAGARSIETLAAVFGSRFSLPCPAVVAALTASVGSGSLSVQQVVCALLPLLVAAGAGFQVYA
jgi:hypothetical protein